MKSNDLIDNSNDLNWFDDICKWADYKIEEELNPSINFTVLFEKTLSFIKAKKLVH